MPGTLSNSPSVQLGTQSLGTIYPGGSTAFETNSLANPTIVTTVFPHGLSSLDTIFFTASAVSVPLLTVTPQQVVTVITPTTFSVPVNCTTGGTSGTYDCAILSAPVTGVGVPVTVNAGCVMGLRVGDTVTISGSAATPSLNGAQIVTQVSADGRSFQIGAITNVTVAESTTAAHFSKTTFYSDIFDCGSKATWLGINITSVMGHAGGSTKIDILGSFTGNNAGTTAANLEWFNTAYATMAAPQTALFAQLTVSSATTTPYKLAGPGEIAYVPFKYFRLKFSTSADIIITPTINAIRK
jgi:hypothetical protein